MKKLTCILFFGLSVAIGYASEKTREKPVPPEKADAALSTEEKIDFLRTGVTRDLYENILPFWMEQGCEDLNDGFVGKLSNDLKKERYTNKGLVLNTRILWAFSAAYRLAEKEDYKEMADRAFVYLVDYFEDEEEGGYFLQLQPRGRPLDKSKSLYAHAFCVYAFSEYYLATESEESLKRAQDTFRLIEEKCREESGLGYHEIFDQEWDPTHKQGIPLGGKSMNAHLHILEAYANLYRAWPDPQVEEALTDLINLFYEKMLNREDVYFHETFAQDWTPTGETRSFGHDFEAAWLLCDASETLKNEILVEQSAELSLRIADQILDRGMDDDGGIFEKGKNGRVIDNEKTWWPQAESIIGFVNTWQRSGDERYLDAAVSSWTFIEEQIIDSENGEWFRSVTESADPHADKVSEWKGPYHNSRACMELIKRLE